MSVGMGRLILLPNANVVFANLLKVTKASFGSLPQSRVKFSSRYWEYAIRVMESWDNKASIWLAGAQSQLPSGGMQSADMIYQPSNPRTLCIRFVSVCFTSLSAWVFLPCSHTHISSSFPLFPLWLLPPPFSLVHHSFSNFSPMPQYPLFPLPPLGSGECPVIVAAASEARLAVTAGGGRRTREHHNVWRRGRRRGRHSCLRHCRPAECPAQLALTRLSHAGQQERVSRRRGVWEGLFACGDAYIYKWVCF